MDAQAAAASSTQSRISCNVGFLTSPNGWFKMIEVIMGLLVWALLASEPYWMSSGLQFVMFVSVTTWCLTVILVIIYILALHTTMCIGAPWQVIEFCFNSFWALMYFIAACVEAAMAEGVDQWVASTVFAFFITVVYIVHALFSYKEWRGAYPCQSSNGGSDVNT